MFKEHDTSNYHNVDHGNENNLDTNIGENLDIPFVAGNIKYHVDNWKKLTDDKHILETVTGCKIDLTQTPYQSHIPNTPKFSEEEMTVIDKELENMLNKQVIKLTEHEEGEFISGIFLRPKKEAGKFRLILNLKPFNKFVHAEHFKMDTITTCIELMSQNCYMASIDLRDAYYSIPIDKSDQKYLKFFWRGKLYGYTCLPMGLACAPRKFVKLLKPVFAYLHSRGHISSGYLDDTYIQGDSFQSCLDNVTETIELLTSLGFFVHREKSVTTPCMKLEHLGFILNSEEMTVSLTEQKFKKMVEKIDNLTGKQTYTIREVASVVGSMVSYGPGVQFGPLYHKQLEIDKSVALKKNMGDFDRNMKLSQLSVNHLEWWKGNALNNPVHIFHGEPEAMLCTDASMSGWGAKLGQNECAGRWTIEERESHINELELKAILFGLQSLCNKLNDKHILIKCDNTTAVAYVNNMGGCRSIKCNIIARQIWDWAISKNIWLSITHIEGRLNVDPDTLSRIFDDRTEWMLNPILFRQIDNMYKPDRDLFASRINRQLNNYISWQPDPQATAVDAFSVNWYNKLNYIFPPFSMMSKVLRKLEEDRAEAIVIAPIWMTQCWFAKLLQMLIEPPRMVPRGKKQLILPFDSKQIHPLWRKMRLCVCRLSGISYRNKEFLKSLKTLSSNHGGQQHKNNMNHTYKDGEFFVLQGKLIPLIPL